MASMNIDSLTKTDFQRAKVRDFVRFLGCLKEGQSAADVFAERWPTSPHVDYLRRKTAVGASVSTAGASSGFLVNDLAAAFVSFAAPFSLLGRLGVGDVPPLTRVPFNTGVGFADPVALGASVAWLQESFPKPLLTATLTREYLQRAKAPLIVVLTDELARFAATGSDDFLQRQLALALSYGLDRLFVDETIAGTSSTPASVTHGVMPIGATGDLDTDLRSLLTEFVNSGGQLASAVLLVGSGNAAAISLSRQDAALTVRGGTLAGLPCLASDAVADRVIVIDTSRVLLADDGELAIERAHSASLVMSDSPANTPGSVVSMFQTNSTAIRLERYMNWKVMDAAAVQWLSGADYLSVGSPA